jgi:tetratricopeptide (TPR) repeat protein
MQKPKPYLAVILLVLVCVLVYLNSLSNGFVFDDRGTIVENKYVTSVIEHLPSFFNASYFKIAEMEASYRPVATLSYHLLYAIFELNPIGYHLGSLSLHIINVILVYTLVGMLQKNKSTALVAGLLFACHPVLTEAVNCISFNEDLLAALFFLLSFIFYIKAGPGNIILKINHYILSLVFFLLGLLSKEMAITLPAIIFVYDIAIRQVHSKNGKVRQTGFIRRVWQTVQNRIGYYLGYAAVTVFYLCLNFLILTKPEDQAFTYGSIAERLLYLPDHIFNFIRLAVVPVNLSADYIFSYPTHFFEVHNIIAVVVLIGIIITSLVIYKQQKEISFGIWWFLLTLFPVYNLIEIFNPVADRYLYLPLVGFCLVVALLFTEVADRIFGTHKKTAMALKIALIVILLGAYSTITVARNTDWKDGVSLWTKTLQTTPGSAVAHGNLGRAYLEQGQLDRAIAEFEAALKIRPQSHKMYYNLGFAYEKKGSIKRAINLYNETLRLKSDYVDAHFNLGNLYARMGRLSDAARAYRSVLESDPQDTEARNNLGVIYARQGKLDQAIVQWELILEIEPANQEVRENIKKAQKMLN